MTALGLACGGDSTGPSASSVTGIAGDNQSASRGAALPVPLSFTALNSSGQPAQGISVTWTATPAAAAAFTPATSTTDVNGVASTSVTLGNTIGPITIQASLNGVSPVTYHVTVLDPCDFFNTYAIGESVNASLATSDCLRTNWYYDYYEVALPPGQQSLRLKMRGTAASFEDTFLDLYTSAGLIAGFDDDSVLGIVGARNSQLDIILPGGTSYVIGANSFDPFATGPYTLSSENRPASLNGCRAVWVMRGIAVTDTIKNTDCADSSAVTKYYEVARIVVFSPTVLTISMKSAALNPSLALYQLNPGSYARTPVASNDDSLAGSNTNAFIQYTVTANNFYDIVVGTSTGGGTGAYTFEVSASTTLSPRVPGSRIQSGGRNTWWRDVAIPKRSRP
ncbi:MAG TPA: hypothetical protein VFM23_00225 [Gemmatimonadales bacterium]|nr:hypothetical protein [Gemmatimonadales bacterium]